MLVEMGVQSLTGAADLISPWNVDLKVVVVGLVYGRGGTFDYSIYPQNFYQEFTEVGKCMFCMAEGWVPARMDRAGISRLALLSSCDLG